MKITLYVTADQATLLQSTLEKAAKDHLRQANRSGVGDLARRGHLSMKVDIEDIYSQVTNSLDEQDDTDEEVGL